MLDKPDAEAFYKKLREQLIDTTLWPSKYLYKFIVKTDKDKIKMVGKIFDFKGAVIKTTESKNGKYTSISINLVMKNADAVIGKYIEVSKKIEGVISL